MFITMQNTMPVTMLQITPTWVNFKKNQTLEAMNEKQPTLLQFNYVFAIMAHLTTRFVHRYGHKN
jgi:hypothetical protein